MPPNPSTAATSAITRKISAHRNMLIHSYLLGSFVTTVPWLPSILMNSLTPLIRFLLSHGTTDHLRQPCVGGQRWTVVTARGACKCMVGVFVVVFAAYPRWVARRGFCLSCFCARHNIMAVFLFQLRHRRSITGGLPVKLSLSLIILTLSLMTVLPAIPTHSWMARVFDFPRHLIGLILIVSLGTFLLLYGIPTDWWLVAVLAGAGALVTQALWILPYSPLHRTQVPLHRATVDSDAVVIAMTLNVYQHNRDYAATSNVVHRIDPDVLLLVEVDQSWISAMNAASASYPHRVLIPQDNTYGMAFYSRYAIRDVEERRLIDDSVPSLKLTVRLPNQREFRIYALHPRPPRPEKDQDSKQRDRELDCVAAEIGRETLPVLVLGDLNDVAWSPETRRFMRLSGLKDPRIGRGLFATFPVGYPLIARFPIDHVFVSEQFALLEVARLSDVGSDHYPFLVKVALGSGETSTAAST
ncbi:hypothetical protein GF420_12935 [candidate division GN15 bacterium]|nr:hypothetical protein [candidate division GN15 bacterium]